MGKTLFLILSAAVAAPWPGHAAAAEAAAPARLPLVQRSGGPLPLSVQNEVDAAIDRARRFLLRETLDAPSRHAEAMAFDAHAWVLTALFHDRRPAVAAQLDSALRAPRPAAEAAPLAELWIRALAAARFDDPGRDPSLGTDFRQAIDEQIERIGRMPPDDPAAAVSRAAWDLVRLLDGADVAGLPFETLIDPPARTGLLDTLKARPPFGDAGSDGNEPESTETARGIVLLRIHDHVAAPRPAGASPAFKRLAPRLMQDRAYLPWGPDSDPWLRAWHGVRLLDQQAPGLLFAPGMEHPVDWRLVTARHLVSAQRTDPADGTGFWQPEDCGATRPHTLRRNTALAILILESL